MAAAYDAFLSYSRSDIATVRAVASSLKDHDLNLFLDQWHLAPGQPWPELLEKALAGCKAVVVFIGPRGLGNWQKREAYKALDRQTVDTAMPVIPVLLPGTDDPALGFLGLNTWVDLRNGVSDEKALSVLARAVRGEAPGAPEAVVDPRAEICPYRGLEPFREEDAAFFFGRDTFTDRLVKKIGQRNLVAVVGASGSGKSSVVRAGLVPRLRRGVVDAVWDVLTIQPGNEPLETLARVLDPPPDDAGLTAARAHVNAAAERLRSGDVTLAQVVEDFLAAQAGTDRLLLVVDQFEELVTLTGDKNDAKKFIDMLLGSTEAGSPLSVVATLRSDFFTEFVRRRDLADRLQDGVVNIGPLSQKAPEDGLSEIEQIVRRPAEAVGLGFDDGLVPRILGDVGTEPGRLPLLEYLLTELWRRRRNGKLTHEAYKDLGGVSGAIAQRAEDAYCALDAEGQRTARRLFLTLVRPGEGREDTRSRAQFPNDPAAADVARRFADAKTRLLVTSEDAIEGRTLEVGHEALIRNWATLRGWVNANRETLRARERVRERMARWREAGEPDDLLLPRGLELEEGRRLLDAGGDVPVDDVLSYINASVESAEASANAERAAVQEREKLLRSQAEQSARLARQRGWITRLSIGALVIVLAVSAFAGLQWQESVKAGADLKIALAETETARIKAVKAGTDLEIALDEAETARGEAETATEAAILAADRNAQLRNLAESEAQRADAERIRAEDQLLQARIAQARFRASKSLELNGTHAYAAAVAVAASAMPQAHESDWPELSVISEVPRALTLAMTNLREDLNLRGHEGPVLSAAFSPDGSRVVTASDDRTARIWDATEGSEIAVLRGHEGPVLSAAFSPDGSRVVTASDDRTARIWDATEGSEIAVLRGHEGPVLSAAFSPDGSRVVTASDDRTARIWDATEGSEIAVLRGHEGRVWSAAFSPDGSRVVTASDDRTARIWDATEGSEIAVLRGHEGPVRSATFSPDGSRVVTASDDRTAGIWDATEGSEIAVLRGHEGRVWSAAFSPDGSRVVTASDDRTARIWDATEGSEIAVLRGHEGRVWSAAFSPDGSRVVTASDDRTARIWDATEGSEIAVLRGHEDWVRSAAFSPDGSRVVTASDDRTARIWDATEGSEIAVLRGHEDWVRSAAFSPDGSRVVTASDDRTARIWDATEGSEIAVLRGHEDWVLSAAFSPDGSRVVTASDDRTARIWDATEGSEIAVLRGHEGPVRSATFSPDGSRVVTASDDRTARIWDATEGSEIAVLRGHEGRVWSATFSPDGSRVVTASDDRTARIWDATEGSEIAVLRGHEGRVWSAAFSPDGSRVVTASDDRTARIWDATEGSEIAVLRGHERPVLSAAFSPDGSRVVTASGDRTARIWDATEGSEIAVLGHERPVLSATFSPDGSRVVTASDDRTARIWKTYRTYDELYEAARGTLDRLQPISLQEECAYYLRTEGCE